MWVELSFVLSQSTGLLGVTGFAGVENDGPSKNGGVNFAGLENDGVEQEQTYILHPMKKI